MIQGYNLILFFKERIYKLKFIKNLKVFNTFSHANIFNRDLKLIAYSNNYPTFGRTVKFSYRQ